MIIMFLQYGDTPLHGAATCGRTDNVKMLLREGADVNVKNEVS